MPRRPWPEPAPWQQPGQSRLQHEFKFRTQARGVMRVMRMQKQVFTWCAILFASALAATAQSWPQWGQNSLHTGDVSVEGQSAAKILAQVVYDPFTAQENVAPLCGGGLCIHDQVPLIDGNNVFLEFKTGTYTSLQTWETQIWNEQRLHWEDGALVRKWAFQSDWKPIPYSTSVRGPAWEPVFHAALAGEFVYVPGSGGTVWKLEKSDGSVRAHLNPFDSIDPHTFLSGPITVDAAGAIYYVTIKLSRDPNVNPGDVNAINSGLVKITPHGHASKVTYEALVPGAPHGNNCLGTFAVADLPWPPSPNAVPPHTNCGLERAAMNSAPAVGPDGTIYVGSVAHLTDRHAYLVAVNPDLTPRWHTSLRDRFHDGCNAYLPPNGQPRGGAARRRPGPEPAGGGEDHRGRDVLAGGRPRWQHHHRHLHPLQLGPGPPDEIQPRREFPHGVRVWLGRHAGDLPA